MTTEQLSKSQQRYQHSASAVVYIVASYDNIIIIVLLVIEIEEVVRSKVNITLYPSNYLYTGPALICKLFSVLLILVPFYETM